MRCRLLLLLLSLLGGIAHATDLPNILWITSEDNAPMLGCYGDAFATTPNLDKFASESFRYTHAYANSPVCSPARNTLITGVYTIANGNQHMRSNYDKSDLVKLYPQLLREAGYYCTNNSKEDFNINTAQTDGIWNELGTKAHYKNRKPGQPFFAIFNSMLTHESSLHPVRKRADLRHDPAKVTLPPYHPDTPELRHDWAYYYDNVEDMDAWVGGILKELEESGEAENTLVFYYSDHGGVLPRSKRFVYESGTHVPLIVHIPKKFKHLYPATQPGSTVDRLVSFVDFPPTLLSMIDQSIPDYMQGEAFLGKQKTSDPSYVFMSRDRQEERYDMYRAVRGPSFRYIRNYMPHRVYGPHQEYLWLSQATRSWEAACQSGNCTEQQLVFWNAKPVEELYDTENDPWEVNNLAADPRYRKQLVQMRKANQDWMLRIRDTGFIPEADLLERTQNTSAYDYMRGDKLDLPQLMAAANMASQATSRDLAALVKLLQHKDAAFRFWGATGLLILGSEARPATSALKAATTDSSDDVAVTAAEVLYKLGEPAAGRPALFKALKSPHEAARIRALNVVDFVGEDSPGIRMALVGMVKQIGKISRNSFDLRLAKWLFNRWKVDTEPYGFQLDWTW